MDFKTEFPDYVAIEAHIKRARLVRSLHLAELIAGAVVASLNALKSFADRSPLRGSRIPWGPAPLPEASITRDRA